MRYFLKRCGHQELGSVKNGKAQRGRYLFVSMDTLDFFPPLSTAQLNDSALLPIIPLYLGKKVYCSYVYHNDKFHNSIAASPRNEYRIYLNTKIEDNQYLFEPGDIVIIRTTKNEETGETVFLLDIAKDKSSELYKKLNAAIDASPIRGGYGVWEEPIEPFEAKAAAFGNEPELQTEIDNSVITRIEATEENTIAGLFNSSSFRDFVMVGYNGLCAVTRAAMRYENLTNLEAAHIRPKSHGGLFLPSNGIALSRDIHWAFDKGFFTLTNECEVKIHPKAYVGNAYRGLENGLQIIIPENPFFRPAIENIEYHRNNVYGLFLNSGRL
jgi:hypothetical protein